MPWSGGVAAVDVVVVVVIDGALLATGEVDGGVVEAAAADAGAVASIGACACSGGGELRNASLPPAAAPFCTGVHTPGLLASVGKSSPRLPRCDAVRFNKRTGDWKNDSNPGEAPEPEMGGATEFVAV